ncbi:MAG: hypothetical protein CM15mP16_00160 [Candidatus Pelagibacterales bacterium]|nr:MAG: hypothetical protein CM15mP16_00160 [Pelagibacterales bacterium]
MQVIEKNDGWCDDPKSKLYNQHIKFPFDASAEKLFRDDDLYDLLCVINHNTDPIVPGKVVQSFYISVNQILRERKDA